jgi:arginine/lysine/histidine transport system permease protein
MELKFIEILPSIPFILEGVLVTLKYTALSLCLGLVWGTVLSLMKISRIKGLKFFSAVYTSIFRGTPLILQLSLVYFASPQLIGYALTPFEAGIITFSLNSGAYVSEIIRAGIQSVDKGQFESAGSLGIPYRLMMKDIILPQAIKNILPALVNEGINLLKETALVSIIGEADLMRRANIVSAEKYIFFEPLLIAGLCYYIMVMILSWFVHSLEKKMRRSD